MKIRLDFVTNSSSSSFIIGKRGDKNTKNTVFLKIVSFYNEMFEKIELLKKDMEKWYLEWDEKNRTFRFNKDKESEWYDNEFELNKALEKEYGISTYDYFPEKEKWLECKTYDEYIAYWTKKRQEEKNNSLKEDNRPIIHSPFFIDDYENDTVVNTGIYNDCTYEDVFENLENSWDLNDLIGWYYNCADELLGDSSYPEIPFEKRDCKYCDRKKGGRLCLEFRANVKNGNITRKNSVLFQLGKICIHSYCGDIPEFVVNKLTGISNYSNNHMG